MLTRMSHHEFWTTPSPVTDPGPAAADIDALAADLATLRRTATTLVFHYRGGGDFAEHGIDPERISEIDSCYADVMFDRLGELGDRSLLAERPPAQRVVGCCRDHTVLFVAMAQRKGYAARARVGFATYFEDDWFIDHVIAEVWDEQQERWRLVEPQVSDEFAARAGFDPLDVPADVFLTGGDAWLRCRSGGADPERFLVAPQLDDPQTRGWRFLRHNLIFDLAALNKQEMVLWQAWGLMATDDEPDPREGILLDELAHAITTADPSVDTVRTWAAHEGFAVPNTVMSFSPAHGEPRSIDVSRIVSGSPATR